MTAAAGVVAAVVAVAVAIQGFAGDGGSEQQAPGPEAAASAEAAAAVQGLSAGELAGQRLVAGWSGGEPPKGLVRMVHSGGLAGVIVFDDNVPSRSGIRNRLERLQRERQPDGLKLPLLVTVDQEGGLVERVPGPPSASAEQMGARGPGYARKQGRRTGASLRRLGINVDLAPVLDVARPGGAIDGEERSFGSSPGRVIRVGVDGFADGLRSRGVAATAKHFPGIGSIGTNTDFASQVVDASKRELRRRDERPFRAFARAGGELVMTSFATYPAFSDRPASFSRAVVTGELRRRLGFEGVTITDGLGAAAAQAFGDDGEIAEAAIGAGNDLLLYTDWREARSVRNLLRDRLAKGKLDRGEFEAAVRRVLELRASLPG